jgi:hypothetical protein
MTLAEAVKLVDDGILGNDQLAAPKRLFDAVEIVLEAARKQLEKDS